MINYLFKHTIPEPINLDPEPLLLILAFDNKQREYLKNNIIPDNVRYFSHIKKLK